MFALFNTTWYNRTKRGVDIENCIANCYKSHSLFFRHYFRLCYGCVYRDVLLRKIACRSNGRLCDCFGNDKFFPVQRETKEKSTETDSAYIHRFGFCGKHPAANAAETSPVYIIDEDNGQILRADGKPFAEEDFPFLQEVGLRRSIERERLSTNPIFHRTAEEHELIYQFGSNYGRQSAKICDVFENFSRAAYEAENIDEKIDLLQRAIDTFEVAKQWHYQHSEGGKLYFQDWWEHLHNSRRECFSWVDNVYAYRDHLVKERDVIVPWILDHAQNGFLQTDIYKVFPEEEKTVLRRIIKALASDGKINMTKKRNTYFISVDEKQPDVFDP